MSGGCRTVPALLLSEGFLHLAEFPLKLPGRLFDFAPRLQAAIVRQLSCFLLGLALYFVKLAFGLILSASLHQGCSLAQDSGSRLRSTQQSGLILFSLDAHVASLLLTESVVSKPAVSGQNG